MTLVLFVPYDEGCILFGDRQNSYDDGYKEEVQKLHLQSHIGPAMGCAGDTELIETLYARMRTETINSRNVCRRVKKLLTAICEELGKTRSYGTAGLYENVEMIIVAADDQRLTPFYMHGLVERPIGEKIEAIPKDNREVRKFLGSQSIDTHTFSERQAILLSEQILTQMVFYNSKIGPPEYHGYDYIRVSKGGFSLIHRNPTKERFSNFSDVLKHVQIEVVEEE